MPRIKEYICGRMCDMPGFFTSWPPGSHTSSGILHFSFVAFFGFLTRGLLRRERLRSRPEKRPPHRAEAASRLGLVQTSVKFERCANQRQMRERLGKVTEV